MKKNWMLIFFLLVSCSRVPLKHMSLSTQTPEPGTPESIGYYSSGCIRGAVSLPPSGNGFQVMRLSRGRFWGHPKLIKFLKKTSEKTLKATGQQLLIGDLGHAKGTPSLTGHASHQSGLDVDIWFKTLSNKRVLDLAERELINTPSFLKTRELVDKKLWSEKHWKILKILASNKEVQRIFINPAIKRLLCAEEKKAFSLEEMAKIRPWFNHDDHFHVRLKCPTDSTECISQKDPEFKEGCSEELDWWFTEEAILKSNNVDRYTYYKERVAKLPNKCQAMLSRD